MRFEWDPRKAEINKRKHGVSFELAHRVFDDPLHLTAPDREVSTEERWQTTGDVGGAVILLVAHTIRQEDDEEVIRMISARKATKAERKRYEENL